MNQIPKACEIKYAQVGEIKMAYYTRGQGEPLMLIPGYAATMAMWDPALLDLLDKNYQLIMFDHRGAGLSSDTIDNNTTIPQMADDAAGLIQALGIKQINILAWSMGARVGQQLLIRHPDSIIKGILCAPDPGGIEQVEADEAVQKVLNDPNVSAMKETEILFTNDDAGRLAAKGTMDRIKEAVTNGSAPNDFSMPKETLIRQARARTTLWSADQSNYENLKNIQIPVMVAGGHFDVIDKPENATIIANQIPFSWLTFFDGGHAFLFQNYKKFAETVKVFLS